MSAGTGALPGLHVGSPLQLGPLSLFPVWTDAPLSSAPRYATTGGVVAEQQEPVVESVRVHNPGTKPLLLCEATMLDGGQQHRVVLADVVVAPGERTDLAVLCVEAGRWSGGGAFDAADQSGGRRVLARTRAAMRGPDAEWDDTAPRGADRQREVWCSADVAQRRFGASPTSSALDVHRRMEARVAHLVAGSEPLPAQRGVVVGVAGHPLLMEVFDHPDTLAAQWQALVRAAAIDAVGCAVRPTPAYRARSFARHAGYRASPVTDTRVLVDDGAVVHLAAISRLHELVLTA